MDFQFLWGWNRRFPYNHRLWSLELSIPLRMKHGKPVDPQKFLAILTFNSFEDETFPPKKADTFAQYVFLSIPLRMKPFLSRSFKLSFSTFNSFEDETGVSCRQLCYINPRYFQFLWGWNIKTPLKLGKEYFSFNSFEDETEAALQGGVRLRLLTFNSFEDETSYSLCRASLRYTFNSFEDETNY